MRVKDVLHEIYDEMSVYDNNGDHIGKVEFVRFGEGRTDGDIPDTITISELLEESLGGSDKLPTVYYPRLYKEGFVRVGRGLLRSDAIVLPSQIADIYEDEVHLTVSKDELVHL